jgi:hypothetical protein
MNAFCAKSSPQQVKARTNLLLHATKPMLYLVPYLPVSLPILVRQFSQRMLNTHPIISFTAGSNHLSNFIIERIIASIRYESLEGLISLMPYLNLTLVRYSCLLCSYYPSPISSYHHYYFKPNISLNSCVPLSQLRLYLSPKPVASAMFMLCLSSRSSPARSKMLLKSSSSNCLTL